ncbi:hypothetical protein Tco_1466204 [Tanacetum coccineum]
MRNNPGMKPKEPTYQVVLDALALTTYYPAFLITDDILGQEFDEPPFKEETLSFIRELSHSGDINYINDVCVDHLHQPWRAFAIIINKCLSGKVSGLGLPDSKKHDKMYYPRFTKAIIHHFLIKDKSISMRNKTFMHTTRDDNLLGTMRFVSRHEDTQVYGALFPKAMTNQAMLDSASYKTYYAIATGGEPPKPKKLKRNLIQPSYLRILLPRRSLPKLIKMYLQPRSQLLNLNRLRRRHRLRLIEAKGDSREEDDDDEDDSEDESGDDKGSDDDGDNNDDDGDNDDNDDDSDDERTESDKDKNLNLNQSNVEHEDEEEEYVDEINNEDDNANNATEENEEEEDDAKELYRDINVEEDAHVTLTVVHETYKTDGPMQSSSVSSEFTSKLLNFENASPTENDIASLMDTTVRHEEPSKSLEAAILAKSFSQPKSTYAVAASLSEFELTKILMDKIEEHKSHLRADYKRELYDTLVKSYNTDKDLFQTYGEVFTLKRSQDEKDKDQDPSAGSDRGTKRRKSSKDVESSRDPKSKEFKLSSSSKGTSRSQHKSSGKSVHAEEPSHTVDDSGV